MKPAETMFKALAIAALVASTAAIGCSNNKSDNVAGPPRDSRSAGKSGGAIHAGSGARSSRYEGTPAPVDQKNTWEVDDKKLLPPSPLRTQQPAPKGDCIPAGMNTATTAFPTGNPSTSAVLVSKGVPPQVMKGEEFDFIICVTNLTSMELTNIQISDQLSSGWRLVSSTPRWANNISSSPENIYAWNVSSLGPGETQRIDIKAVADNTSDMINACAFVKYESGVCVATKVVEPALQLAKSGPSEVLKCEQITYRYRVTNSGTGSASDVVITDDFPAGMTTAGSGSNKVNIPVGTLGPGQTREFTVTATTDRTGRFQNTAYATAKPGLNAKSETVNTIVRQPKLALSVDCPENRFFGRDAEVCVKLTNTGDGIARNATMEATIPAGASFKSATNNGRLAGNKVVWSVGDLAPDASREACYTLTTNNAGTLRNYVVANAACADQVTDECVTSYEGIPAILVECIDLEDPDEVGTTETYVITVTNQGTAPDTNIRLICNIPNAMSYQSSDGPTAGTARGQRVTFAPLATLAPKAKATWRVTVLGNEPGQVRFEIQVTSDQFKDPPIMETEATNLYR